MMALMTTTLMMEVLILMVLVTAMMTMVWGTSASHDSGTSRLFPQRTVTGHRCLQNIVSEKWKNCLNLASAKVCLCVCLCISWYVCVFHVFMFSVLCKNRYLFFIQTNTEVAWILRSCLCWSWFPMVKPDFQSLHKKPGDSLSPVERTCLSSQYQSEPHTRSLLGGRSRAI